MDTPKYSEAEMINKVCKATVEAGAVVAKKKDDEIEKLKKENEILKTIAHCPYEHKFVITNDSICNKCGWLQSEGR